MKSRDQIIDAAGRLILLRGYRATTVDEVVARSGVSKGALYHHFPTKEDLGRAALDHLFRTRAARLREAMAKRPGPLDRLEALMQAMVEAQEESGLLGCPLGNLALELGSSHEGFRRHVEALLGILHEDVRACLEGAKRSGLVPAGLDTGRAARFLLAALEGGILLAKAGRDLAVFEACVEEARAYLRMLRREAAGGGNP